MSNALNPLPDDEDEALMVVGSDTITLSRLQVIHLLIFLYRIICFISSISNGF